MAHKMRNHEFQIFPLNWTQNNHERIWLVMYRLEFHVRSCSKKASHPVPLAVLVGPTEVCQVHVRSPALIRPQPAGTCVAHAWAQVRGRVGPFLCARSAASSNRAGSRLLRTGLQSTGWVHQQSIHMGYLSMPISITFQTNWSLFIAIETNWILVIAQ